MAYFFESLTDEFIVPIVLSILKIRAPAEAYRHFFTPDVSFFCFFGIICLLILRFVQKIAPVVYVVYGASLFFCFFYFFIAPVESVIMMTCFVVPVFMWHQNRVSNIGLAVISVLLILISWYFLQKPVVFLLMMPMCHLVAIRANNALQSRYSEGQVRVLSRLSSTQKKKINPNHSIFKYDLWEIIGPEIDALVESWSKVQNLASGQPAGEIAEAKVKMHSSGILASMLEIQNKEELTLALTGLQKRDPGFHRGQFMQKFREAFQKIYDACFNHKIESIQVMVSDALFEQFRCRIDEQKDAGVRFNCPQVQIEEVAISRLESDGQFDELHLMVTGYAVEEAIDIVTGETLNAENKTQRINEFWSYIRRPSAKTLSKPGLMEGSCPNCGSPIAVGQATVCPVCSSFIRSGNYDWVLSKITQACEWEYANPLIVPGWNELKASDEHFSIHQIEDRCAVIFWMIRLIERQRTMKPLLRFATEKCCETFGFALKGVSYTYFENVSFASATLKAIVLNEDYEKIYLKVVWSGIPVTCTAEGRHGQLHRFSRPKTDIFVLVRKPGEKTNANNTLSSAHCPQCGGPLTSNFVINCEFCNTLLNDGSEWLLEKIINDQSQEYNAVLTQKRQLIQKVVANAKKAQGDDRTIRSGRDIVTLGAQMLLADGKIDDREMEFLRELAGRYAMPADNLQGIIESIKDGELFIPATQTIMEKHSLMEAAARMALVDGEISPGEREYLETLASKFGYISSDLNMLIKREKRRMAQEKKAAEILKRKTY